MLLNLSTLALIAFAFWAIESLTSGRPARRARRTLGPDAALDAYLASELAQLPEWDYVADNLRQRPSTFDVKR